MWFFVCGNGASNPNMASDFGMPLSSWASLFIFPSFFSPKIFQELSHSAKKKSSCVIILLALDPWQTQNTKFVCLESDANLTKFHYQLESLQSLCVLAQEKVSLGGKKVDLPSCARRLLGRKKVFVTDSFLQRVRGIVGDCASVFYGSCAMSYCGKKSSAFEG